MNDKVTVIPLHDVKERIPPNPLVADNAEDTAGRVRAVLRFLQTMEPNDECLVDHVYRDVRYGRSLIYDMMIDALTASRED